VKELARLAAGSANVADLLKRRAIQDRDTFFDPSGNVDETLLRIGRQRNAERSPRFPSLRVDESFFQKSAVQPERLDAVVARSDT